MKQLLPRKLLPFAIILIVAGCLIQATTYLNNAESTAPLAGFSGLGDFSNLRHYRFVAFHAENWDSFTEAQREVQTVIFRKTSQMFCNY